MPHSRVPSVPVSTEADERSASIAIDSSENPPAKPRNDTVSPGAAPYRSKKAAAPAASATRCAYWAAEQSPAGATSGHHRASSGTCRRTGPRRPPASTTSDASIRTSAPLTVRQRTPRTRPPRRSTRTSRTWSITSAPWTIAPSISRAPSARMSVSSTGLCGSVKLVPSGPTMTVVPRSTHSGGSGGSMPASSKCRRTTPLSQRAPAASAARCSSSTTRRPRRANCRATPAPAVPAPTTTTSAVVTERSPSTDADRQEPTAGRLGDQVAGGVRDGQRLG